ncbi:MAG: ABC transporter permease subunit [Anaerolineae bacterium]|nr:ABC transporter permease subunit [Anaerolineae bacterium]
MDTTITRKRKRLREPNPLLVKELRGRMRGARAFVVLTIYLLLLSCLTSVIYFAYITSSDGPAPPNLSEAGLVIFSTVVLLELFIVTFITPAFTAGAITGERDRQTYELLRATLLPARDLVMGKLTSALTYVGLLILAAIPLEGLAFMLGGVTPEDLILALVVTVVTAFSFAVIGLFFSAIMKSTLSATVLSYGMALLITVGLPIILLFTFGVLGEPLIFGYSSNPVPLIVRTLLFYTVYVLANLSPVVAAVITKVVLINESAIWVFWLDIGSTYSSTAPTAATKIPVPSGWVVYTLIYLSLALILLVTTTHIVRRQEMK